MRNSTGSSMHKHYGPLSIYQTLFAMSSSDTKSFGRQWILKVKSEGNSDSALIGIRNWRWSSSQE